MCEGITYISKLNYNNHSIRYLVIKQRVWLVAKDIIAALELTWHSRQMKKVKLEKKKKINHLGLNKNNKTVWLIQPDYLWPLILKAKKNEVFKFISWLETVFLNNNSNNNSIFIDNLWDTLSLINSSSELLIKLLDMLSFPSDNKVTKLSYDINELSRKALLGVVYGMKAGSFMLAVMDEEQREEARIFNLERL